MWVEVAQQVLLFLFFATIALIVSLLAGCIFDLQFDRIPRWIRHKWRYRPSNMRRLREEQQDINAIAAGDARDPLHQALDLLDMLSEIPPDKENEDD